MRAESQYYIEYEGKFRKLFDNCNCLAKRYLHIEKLLRMKILKCLYMHALDKVTGLLKK
jgi:hypothetical protein